MGISLQPSLHAERKEVVLNKWYGVNEKDALQFFPTQDRTSYDAHQSNFLCFFQASQGGKKGQTEISPPPPPANHGTTVEKCHCKARLQLYVVTGPSLR